MVAMVASLMGFEPTSQHPQIQRWQNEGRLHEKDIVDKLVNESGFVVDQPFDRLAVPGTEDLQWQVQLPFPGGVTVVGHMDGLVAGETQDLFSDIPVEAKSVGQWTWDNKVIKLGIDNWVRRDMPYAYQYQSYLDGAGQERGVYAVKNRNNGRFAWQVLGAPLAHDAIENRVAEVLNWFMKGQLPPCDGRCSDFSSPWWHVHEKKPQLPPQQVRSERIRKLVTDYKALSDAEKDMKTKKDSIKKELTPMLEEGKWHVETSDGRKVTVTKEEKTIKRLSEGMLREKFGDEAVEECYESTTYPDSVTIR